MFASHSQAKEFQIRFQLTNLSKGDQSISDYFRKVRFHVDSLAVAGNILLDKDVVTYLLNSLGSTFESFTTYVITQVESLNSHELF